MPGLPQYGESSKFPSARNLLERRRLGAVVKELGTLAVSKRVGWGMLAAVLGSRC